ncbi:hypothetical protein K1719_036563 [Acacia pycnantha]|nr:hypothetical protein K1719_036563 [Acacia pycnantha]
MFDAAAALRHWKGITCSGNRVTEMDLSFNSLTMYVQNNQFTGTIVVLAGLPLATLNEQNNHFTGWIPEQLKNINLQKDGNAWSSSSAPPPHPGHLLQLENVQFIALLVNGIILQFYVHLYSDFNAALGGCVFSVESVLWSSPVDASMVVLSAVIASVVSQVGVGSEHAFNVLDYDFRSIGNTTSMHKHMVVQDKQKLEVFSKWLLHLGDGKLGLPHDSIVDVEILEELLICYFEYLMHAIVSTTNPNLLENLSNSYYFNSRAILCPTIESVNNVNQCMCSLLLGELMEYYSYDTICNPSQEMIDLKIYIPLNS